MNLTRYAAQVVAFVAVAGTAVAHDPGISTATVHLGSRQLEVELVVAARDIVHTGGLDRNHDRRLSEAEISRSERELHSLAASALDLRLSDRRLAPAAVGVVALDGGREIAMRLHYPLPASAAGRGSLSVSSPIVEELPHGHRQYLRVIGADGTVLTSAMVGRRSRPITARLPDPSLPDPSRPAR